MNVEPVSTSKLCAVSARSDDAFLYGDFSELAQRAYAEFHSMLERGEIDGLDHDGLMEKALEEIESSAVESFTLEDVKRCHFRAAALVLAAAGLVGTDH